MRIDRVRLAGTNEFSVCRRTNSPINPAPKGRLNPAPKIILIREPSLEEVLLYHLGWGNETERSQHMSAELATAKVKPDGRSPGTIVARQTGKKSVRSGAGWGIFFGVLIASSAFTYLSSYKTAASRNGLAASFGSNTALATLFGPAHELQTVAGFTAYKVLAVLSITGAMWGLLTGTRLMRGEEDAGRWEILLTGQTTKRAAAAQALAGLGAGLAGLFVVTATITAIVGQSSQIHFTIGQSTFFALALVCTAAVFLAVGALTSQLVATRREAATYGAYVLAICYALRMIPDSGIGLEWLRWATPFGWVELLQPLTASDWVPLLPTLALVLLLAGVTVKLAGIRDLGASIFPDRITAPMRTRLLNGTLGLNARLSRPTVIAWGVALAVTAVIYGIIAKPAGATLATSNSVNDALSRLGARGAGTETYLGVVFLMLAVMLAFVAAGQITFTRTEEAEGHLEQLLVQPLSRWSWYGGRLLEAAAVLVFGGLEIGLFCWLGTASGHAGLPLSTLIGAGLNVVPPALLILGVGALALGTWPRTTSIAVYGLVAWSVIVELIGGLSNTSRWLLDTSVFHQMAPAPASAPNWTVGAVMIGIGAVAAIIGAVAFRHRDLTGS